MVQLVLDRMSILIRSDRTSILIRSGPYAYGPNTHMVWNIYMYNASANTVCCIFHFDLHRLFSLLAQDTFIVMIVVRVYVVLNIHDQRLSNSTTIKGMPTGLSDCRTNVSSDYRGVGLYVAPHLYNIFISLFLNKTLQYIGIENYKYIHVQLNVGKKVTGKKVTDKKSQEKKSQEIKSQFIFLMKHIKLQMLKKCLIIYFFTQFHII